MNDCCEPKDKSFQKNKPKPICPHCEAKGRKVDEMTPKSLLTPQARARYKPGQYYFCAGDTCPVVYFSVETSLVFKSSEVEVPVWQKEKSEEPSVLVCYCFGHSDSSIRDGQSENIYQEIKAHVQAGRCACEIKNPQGSCCLGNVQQVIKKVTG